MGNKRCKFITPNRYYAKKFVRDHLERYDNNMFSEVREALSEGYYNFVVVELEGAELKLYNKLTDLASDICGFEYYGIDVIRDFEVSQKYCKHGRGHNDIERISKEIKNNPVTYWHKILDPIELIEPGWKAANPTPEPIKFVPKKLVREKSYDEDMEECFSCHG